MDLTDTEHDQESFERYVYGSAEVVGLMCLRAFVQGMTIDAEQNERLVAGARALGAAFQKVNFLRDLSAEPVPHLDAERFGAFIAPKEKRSERQNHVARAGVYLDTPRDTQTGYVRDFLGITDVEFVYAEGLAISEASKTASLARARESLQVLVPALA